jgi:hypothetical protein
MVKRTEANANKSQQGPIDMNSKERLKSNCKYITGTELMMDNFTIELEDTWGPNDLLK